MPVAVAVCSGAALAVLALLALAGWARLRFTRRYASFRCRLGPPTVRVRRARWRLLPTRAAWCRDVLLVRSGPFHLGVTPVGVGVPRAATVRQLDAREARGLGKHPAALRFTSDEGGGFEVAVAGDRVAQLVGPFLSVLLPDQPPASRDMDA